MHVRPRGAHHISTDASKLTANSCHCNTITRQSVCLVQVDLLVIVSENIISVFKILHIPFSFLKSHKASSFCVVHLTTIPSKVSFIVSLHFACEPYLDTQVLAAFWTLFLWSIGWCLINAKNSRKVWKNVVSQSFASAWVLEKEIGPWLLEGMFVAIASFALSPSCGYHDN